jgi:hypothetical protein
MLGWAMQGLGVAGSTHKFIFLLLPGCYLGAAQKKRVKMIALQVIDLSG